MRRHEDHLIGLSPKRPIKDIQDEREKEAGEKSWQMPAYGKAFERMVKQDIAAQRPLTDEELLADWPDKDDKKPNPFDPSDEVPF